MNRQSVKFGYSCSEKSEEVGEVRGGEGCEVGGEVGG